VHAVKFRTLRPRENRPDDFFEQTGSEKPGMTCIGCNGWSCADAAKCENFQKSKYRSGQSHFVISATLVYGLSGNKQLKNKKDEKIYNCSPEHTGCISPGGF
jgi:hypothetical protein